MYIFLHSSRCTKIALVKVQELTEIIKTAIEEDVKKKRQIKKPQASTRYFWIHWSELTLCSFTDDTSAFSSGGIGASESIKKDLSNEADFLFHHNTKSVSIGQESIEKNVSPVLTGKNFSVGLLMFSDKDAQEDFAEFVKFFKSAQVDTHFEDMEDEEDEEEEVEEVEQESEESSADIDDVDLESEDDSEEELAMTLDDEFVQATKKEPVEKMDVASEPANQEPHKSASSDDACGW